MPQTKTIDDLVAELKVFLADQSDLAQSQRYLLTREDVVLLVNHVERLGSVSGAVTPGPSLVDIKAAL